MRRALFDAGGRGLRHPAQNRGGQMAPLPPPLLVARLLATSSGGAPESPPPVGGRRWPRPPEVTAENLPASWDVKSVDALIGSIQSGHVPQMRAVHSALRFLAEEERSMTLTDLISACARR